MIENLMRRLLGAYRYEKLLRYLLPLLWMVFAVIEARASYLETDHSMWGGLLGFLFAASILPACASVFPVEEGGIEFTRARKIVFVASIAVCGLSALVLTCMVGGGGPP